MSVEEKDEGRDDSAGAGLLAALDRFQAVREAERAEVARLLEAGLAAKFKLEAAQREQRGGKA